MKHDIINYDISSTMSKIGYSNKSNEEIIRTKILKYNEESLKEGSTCLHIAVKSEDCDVVWWLTDNERSPFNLKDYAGAIPLHYSAADGNIVITRALTRYLSYKNVHGITHYSIESLVIKNKAEQIALDLALSNGHTKIAEALVPINPAVMQKYHEYLISPLHLGIKYGDDIFINYLLKSGKFDLEKVYDSLTGKYTPLEYCYHYKRYQIATDLLVSGSSFKAYSGKDEIKIQFSNSLKYIFNITNQHINNFNNPYYLFNTYLLTENIQDILIQFAIRKLVKEGFPFNVDFNSNYNLFIMNLSIYATSNEYLYKINKQVISEVKKHKIKVDKIFSQIGTFLKYNESNKIQKNLNFKNKNKVDLECIFDKISKLFNSNIFIKIDNGFAEVHKLTAYVLEHEILLKLLNSICRKILPKNFRDMLNKTIIEYKKYNLEYQNPDRYILKQSDESNECEVDRTECSNLNIKVHEEPLETTITNNYNEHSGLDLIGMYQ